jgi:hypothetical protein
MFLTHIQKMYGLNLSQYTHYPDQQIHGFPQILQKNLYILPSPTNEITNNRTT